MAPLLDQEIRIESDHYWDFLNRCAAEARTASFLRPSEIGFPGRLAGNASAKSSTAAHLAVNTTRPSGSISYLSNESGLIYSASTTALGDSCLIL
jgi:hypothetical protein